MIRYYANDTPLHTLDARVKIVMLIVFTLLVFLSRSLPVLSLVFVLILAGWRVAGISLKELGGYLRLLTGVIFFVVAIQALFQSGKTILVQPLIPAFVPLIGGTGHITLEGTLFGLLLGFRILVIMCLMPLIIMTTRVRDLSLGFVKLGLPYRIAFMITTALNQVPLLQDEIAVITDAQKLRALTVFEDGRWWQKLRAFPTLVVPLVMGAMKKSIRIATAMDVRAFGSKPTRSYLHDITMKPSDWQTLTVLTLLAVVLFGLDRWFR